MKPVEHIAMIIFTVGSVVGLSRYAFGASTDEVDVQHAQMAVEALCMIGLLFLISTKALALKNTNTKNLIYYGCMVGIFVVIGVAFPELQENPNTMRTIGIIVGLAGAFAMTIGVNYYIERKRRKAHPDGYFHKFGQAMREARNGATVESESGRTVSMGGDGHLVFDAPLEPKDLESMWRVVSTDGEGSS